MINLKSKQEISIMAEAGKRLKKVVDELIPLIKPDISTNFIDRKAEELILKLGGKPSFKEVKGYKWTTCLPINEQIVHTPPSERKIREGDILTLDIGFYFKNFHTDYATSIKIGNNKNISIDAFLLSGKKAMKNAIKQVKINNHIGDISKSIQQSIEKHGYNVSESLVGHGIGRNLHEDPNVPGLLEDDIKKTPRIVNGLVIAVEVIYMMGDREVELEKGNDWSIKTKDNSLSACFEHTIAVDGNEATILV